MRNLPRAFLALLLVLAASCSRPSRSRGAGAHVVQEVPRPPVVGVASVASLTDAFLSAASYANAIQPGAGLMLNPLLVTPGLAKLVGADSLDGIEVDAPMHLVILDPKKNTDPFVLVGTVSDAKALATAAGKATLKVEGKRAVLGARAAVGKVAGWAFASLSEAPKDPRLTLYVQPLLDGYREEIEEFRRTVLEQLKAEGSPAPDLMKEILDMYLGTGEDIDRAELSVLADAKVAALRLALVPRAGTNLAKFTELQDPGDCKLLGKLPAMDAASMLFCGRFVLGPYHEALLGWAERAGVTWVDPTTIGALLDEFTGEVAAVLRSTENGFRMSFNYRINDANRVRELQRTLFTPLAAEPTEFDFAGMKITLRYRQNAVMHDGVPISLLTAKLDMADPMTQAVFETTYGRDGLQLAFAAFDDLWASGGGPAAAEDLKAIIDTARGRRPSFSPTPGQSQMMADSAERKEFYFGIMSMLDFMRSNPMVSDLLKNAPPSQSGFGFGLGAEDGALSFRVAFPAEHVRDMVKLFQGQRTY